VSQSPELAGGAGFTFEDAVSAEYLIALLGEGYAPGTGNRIVSRVALQQRDFGEPLDDIIVDSHDSKGGRARLSLQVKRSLTISKAKTNTDFRDIIRDSWLTFSKDDFRRNVDRFGAAVGSIAKDKGRALVTLGELARESLTVDHFEARFTEAGNASAELVSIKEDITDLLNEISGGSCPASSVQEFLAHFVLINFDYLHAGSTSRPEAMNKIRDALAADHGDSAPLIFATLCQLAREASGKSGEFDRHRLVRELSTLTRLRGAPSLKADLDRIASLARDWIADIKNDVGGASGTTQTFGRIRIETRRLPTAANTWFARKWKVGPAAPTSRG